MKNGMNSLTILIALSGMTIFWCCNNEMGSSLIRTSCVHKPFENVDVPENTFQVDPIQTSTFSTESGTTITIPANCLVDRNNKVITEKVNVTYKEYQTPADILVSGIPMSYDSAGSSYNFSSAGMFDISAVTESNDMVYIAGDKSITVAMGSFNDGEDYSMYKLDTVTQNWVYLGYSDAQPNTAKLEKMEEIEDANAKPVLPKKKSNDDLVFDFDLKTNSNSELSTFRNIMWRYSEAKGFPDPADQDWVFKTNWTTVDLETYNKENNLYLMKLGTAERSFTTVVEPVLGDSDYEEALAVFNEQMKNYEIAMDAGKRELERITREADLQRTFVLNKFGTYNCDKILRQDNSVQVAASFEFDEGIDLSLNDIRVYHVVPSLNAVIGYDAKSIGSLTIDPNIENKLVAVLPGDRIAVFSSKDFAQIDMGELKSMDKPAYKFFLSTYEKSVASVEDLNKILFTI
jgi:hypothetical protein